MYKSTAYDRLCRAVQSCDETAISRAANDLTVRGIVTDAMLHEHYDRVSKKLAGRNGRSLSSVLAYKEHQFASPKNRPANVNLKELRATIDVLSDSVRILSRLQSVVGNELRRRGEVVSAMVEERTDRTVVHA